MERKAVIDAMQELLNQQGEALREATFLPFTRDQAVEYDARAARIAELRKMLSST